VQIGKREERSGSQLTTEVELRYFRGEVLKGEQSEGGEAKP